MKSDKLLKLIDNYIGGTSISPIRVKSNYQKQLQVVHQEKLYPFQMGFMLKDITLIKYDFLYNIDQRMGDGEQGT